MNSIEWPELKALIDSGSINYRHIELSNKYLVVGFDAKFEINCTIYKTSTEATEYETSYKAVGEKMTLAHYGAPFASKILPSGKRLFKRVHGVNASIPAGQTGYLELVVPYAVCKFTGAEIFGCDVEDTLDFLILDDDNNTYSGAPVEYPNWVLNQFGFDVEMPPGGKYTNTSNYDADLFSGMVLSCAYKNNGTETKYISMNAWLHEVKD